MLNWKHPEAPSFGEEGVQEVNNKMPDTLQTKLSIKYIHFSF